VHTRTGFVDFGYRFYSPSLGRWINRDPIEESGGLNLYAAFANDPVNKWDEYGEAVPLAVGLGIAVRTAAPHVARAAPVIVAGAKKLLSRSSKATGKASGKASSTVSKTKSNAQSTSRKPHGNRRNNQVKTCVYRIDYDNGYRTRPWKVGITSGTLLGSQSRINVQVRRFERQHPEWKFTGRVIKRFDSREAARTYETNLIVRYKSRYGGLPGNPVNR
jgi:uncharacterized protein RhaS with RHS repeats